MWKCAIIKEYKSLIMWIWKKCAYNVKLWQNLNTFIFCHILIFFICSAHRVYPFAYNISYILHIINCFILYTDSAEYKIYCIELYEYRIETHKSKKNVFNIQNLI